eukprot:g5097.t1
MTSNFADPGIPGGSLAHFPMGDISSSHISGGDLSLLGDDYLDVNDSVLGFFDKVMEDEDSQLLHCGLPPPTRSSCSTSTPRPDSFGSSRSRLTSTSSIRGARTPTSLGKSSFPSSTSSKVVERRLSEQQSNKVESPVPLFSLIQPDTEKENVGKINLSIVGKENSFIRADGTVSQNFEPFRHNSSSTLVRESGNSTGSISGVNRPFANIGKNSSSSSSECHKNEKHLSKYDAKEKKKASHFIYSRGAVENSENKEKEVQEPTTRKLTLGLKQKDKVETKKRDKRVDSSRSINGGRKSSIIEVFTIIPEGLKAGDNFTSEYKGVQYNVEIPEGRFGGQQLPFDIDLEEHQMIINERRIKEREVLEKESNERVKCVQTEQTSLKKNENLREIQPLSRSLSKESSSLPSSKNFSPFGGRPGAYKPPMQTDQSTGINGCKGAGSFRQWSEKEVDDFFKFIGLALQSKAPNFGVKLENRKIIFERVWRSAVEEAVVTRTSAECCHFFEQAVNYLGMEMKRRGIEQSLLEMDEMTIMFALCKAHLTYSRKRTCWWEAFSSQCVERNDLSKSVNDKEKSVFDTQPQSNNGKTTTGLPSDKLVEKIDISNIGLEYRKSIIRLELMPFNKKHRLIMRKKRLDEFLVITNVKGLKKISTLTNRLSGKWMKALSCESVNWIPEDLKFYCRSEKDGGLDSPPHEVWGKHSKNISISDVYVYLNKPKALRLFYKFGGKRKQTKKKETSSFFAGVKKEVERKENEKSEIVTSSPSSSHVQAQKNSIVAISPKLSPKNQDCFPFDFSNSMNPVSLKNSTMCGDRFSGLEDFDDDESDSFYAVHSVLSKQLDANLGISNLTSPLLRTMPRKESIGSIGSLENEGDTTKFSESLEKSNFVHTSEDEKRANSFLKIVTPALIKGDKKLKSSTMKAKRKLVRDSIEESKGYEDSRKSKKRRRICPSKIGEI